jgi:hypothetical protein
MQVSHCSDSMTHKAHDKALNNSQDIQMKNLVPKNIFPLPKYYTLTKKLNTISSKIILKYSQTNKNLH